MTSFDERRAAALRALSRRTPPPVQRYPGETRPSGDMPEDPWRAEAYFAERWPEETAIEFTAGAPE